MTTEIPDFVIITNNKTSGQGGKEHRWTTLRNSFVRCPRCSEIWLVPGATENNQHLCADCQHVFLIKLSTITN